MCSRARNLVIALIAIACLPGCEAERWTHGDLDATLWMQTSAEYQVACRQAFQSAQQQLARALEDPGWSAELNQETELSTAGNAATSLPPAVILDVDETVLNNSPFQARLIRKNANFDQDSWHQWVEEAKAQPIPGSSEFVKAAREAGVAVFFVTNRENAVEHLTRRNLEALAMIEPGEPDRILSKRERDDWTSDKASRREHIAERYRILMMLGDDLNDFVSVGHKPTAEQRRELSSQHADKWGIKWILLPNANYGGWERALYQWDESSSDASKTEMKFNALNEAREDNPRALPLDQPAETTEYQGVATTAEG